MSTGDAYEKLQLTKQDLRYVYTQMLNSMMAKLDLHLPTNNEDSMKNNVTNLLHDYLKEVFEMAKHAMVVDGVDMSSSKAPTLTDALLLKPKEKTEPFNSELNSELKSLLEMVEKEVTEVTQLRKTVPKDIASLYDRVVSETDSNVSAFIVDLDENYDITYNDNNEPDDNNLLPHIDELVGTYEQHLNELSKLKQVVPQQHQEIQTLNDLAQFLQDHQ